MTPLMGRLLDAIDRRTGLRSVVRKTADKVFPGHWSFLLGEVALITFGILVVTGIVLALFYRPFIDPVAYSGSAELYQGRTVPAVFGSILRLTHDIPGGLLLRRIHRAASHLFVAAVIAHMLRILLTGAFRRPREINHVVGVALLGVVVAQGYIGHNLPWDALAGTSLRIAYTFIASIPWVGPQIAVAAFGGQFPSAELIPRLHLLHVFVLPALIAGLIGLHMLILVRQSHTQRPRSDIDDARTVVGERVWPAQTAKTTSLALGVTAILAASAVLVPWADVDLHGPYAVGQTTNAAQPDWFLFWVEGGLRLYPGLDIPLPGGAMSGPFVVGVVLPLLLVVLLALYPWIERRLIHDDGPGTHHGLQHPMDVPVRAGLVAGIMTMLTVLTVAAGNDVVARLIGAPTEAVVIALRVLLLVLPPLVGFAVTSHARRQPARWRRDASSTDSAAGADR
jgi:ubiquinol-cytochrome c reductase cytochrome b subunit